MRSSEIETLDCDSNTTRFGNVLSFKMYGVCGSDSERRSSFMMHSHRHVQDALRLFADKQRSETILYTNFLLVLSRLQLRHFKGSFFFFANIITHMCTSKKFLKFSGRDRSDLHQGRLPIPIYR